MAISHPKNLKHNARARHLALGILMGAAGLLGVRYLAEEPRYGLSRDWTTLGEYFARVERQRTSVNIASYVGSGQVRMDVMGKIEEPQSARGNPPGYRQRLARLGSQPGEKRGRLAWRAGGVAPKAREQTV
jgi:hypothetical protein